MEADLAQLEEALHFESKAAVLSKDVLVSIPVAASAAAIAFAAPFVLPGVFLGSASLAGAVGALALAGGLLATRNKHQQARAKLMRELPMAYLYELRAGWH